MQESPRWRFGPFEADPHERCLWRSGQAVPLRHKAFALLAALLKQPGRLVTKGELFDTVWAGRVVSDAALSRAVHELRAALADDAADPRYIATAHGLGFRFIAAVSFEAALASAAQPAAATTAATAPRLVGREAELNQLDSVLQQALSGQRQMVFVTGEPGIGKTSLVEAFLARHASPELWTAQGRCIQQYGQREAFLPLLEALEQLSRRTGADRMRELLLRYAPAWLAQLPWLAHGADPALLHQAQDSLSAQRLLRELAQSLEILAAQTPLVLWLEDLHWSDHASLDVLAFLAGRREPARLLVIASFRPGDAQSLDSPLTGLVYRLLQQGQARSLPLGLLDVAAVDAYLRKRLAGGLAPSARGLAAFIHGRTDGNALFTVSLVDDLLQREQLVRGPAGWAVPDGVSGLSTLLPDSLRQLVREQLAQLAPGDQRLIEAAAVTGTDFNAGAVAAALQGDTAEIEDRCTRLAQAAGLVQVRAPVRWPDGSSSAGFAFLHALYWQCIYEQIPHSRRGQWQHRIAQRQEQAWGAQVGQIATELAMRFEAAQDLPRCLHYLRLAGAGALQRCAYLECVDLLQHALSLVQQLPAHEQPQQELKLRLPLGAALMAAQGYAAKDVEANYQRALLLCRGGVADDSLVRVLRGLWNVALVRADLAQAQAVAEELLVHARSQPALAFDAHAKLGQTCMHLGHLAQAREQLQVALALPAVADDRARQREAPRVLAYLSWVLWFSGHPAQGRACAEQALTLAPATASPHTQAFVFGFVALLSLFVGERERATALARQQLHLSIEHDLNYWRLWSELTHALAQARPGQAPAQVVPQLAAMHEALQGFEAMGAVVGMPHFLGMVAQAELDAGRLDRAGHALAQARALVEQNGNALNGAELLRLQGEVALANAGGTAFQEAGALLDAAVTLARSQGARALELRAIVSRARLWARQGQAQRAAAALQPLLAAVDEVLGSEEAQGVRGLMRSLALPL